jgi:hypothetical protein
MRLTDIATKHDVAVDGPHHVHKGQIEPGDADAGRGASALKDAARLVNTCMPMSDEEAQTFGISQEDRTSYIRVDNAKVNIFKKSAAAKWYRLVDVGLDNTEMNPLYRAGDHVQTVEPWTPPKAWAGLNDDNLDTILDKINRGLGDGNFYSDASSADDRAAWKAVRELVPTKTEGQAREIIRTWVKNGTLVRFDYQNPNTHREVKGLKVSDEKLTEMAQRARQRPSS